MTSTRLSRRFNAPRAGVYRALFDADAVATWMVPAGTGKNTAHTDTFHGRFLPPSLSPADNEIGWRESLVKLATLVERG